MPNEGTEQTKAIKASNIIKIYIYIYQPEEFKVETGDTRMENNNTSLIPGEINGQGWQNNNKEENNKRL